MRPEKIDGEAQSEPWPFHAVGKHDRHSERAMRLIELAHTLAAAETAVLTGDEAKALEDLKRLQRFTSEVVAELEHRASELA